MKCTYSSYTKVWYLFAQPRKIDPLQPTVSDLAEYFSQEVRRDVSSLKTVLQCIIHDECIQFLSLKSIQKFCNKHFYRAPYGQCLISSYVWDKDMVLDYYKELEKLLTLMKLSQKCAILQVTGYQQEPFRN